MSEIAIGGRQETDGSFRRGTMLLIVAVGIAAFCAMLVLGAYAPDLRSGKNGGAHALSNAATRGGQEHQTLLWRRIGWELAMDWITTADFRGHQQSLEHIAGSGQNVLFVPDPADAESVKRDAVLGTLTPTAGVGFPDWTSQARTWRARIVDRL